MVDDDQIIKILRQNLPLGEHTKITLFEESVNFWANKNNNLMRKWLQETSRFLEIKIDDVDVYRFIVNIYGVTVDINSFLEDKVRNFKKVVKNDDLDELQRILKTEIKNIGMASYCDSLVSAYRSISQIKSNFSEDEIFKLRFFRHVISHPTLSNYTASLKKEKIEIEHYSKFKNLIGYDLDKALLSFFHEAFVKLKKCEKEIKKLEGDFFRMIFS